MTRVWFNKTFSSVHAALTLVRQGDLTGEYFLVCSSPNPHAIGPLAAHEAAVEAHGLTGSDYVGWCLEFCRERKIDIFVPGKEASLISSRRDEFGAIGTRVLCAALPEALELIHSKERFYQTARAPSAPAPEFAVFDRLETFNSAYKEMRVNHPVLCMKPTVSVYGIGFRQIVENRTAFDLLMDGDPYRVELQSLREMLERIGQFRSMLLMPYLAGYEFSVDCVAQNGALVCAVIRRKPLKAGRGQEIIIRDDIMAACIDLVRQFALNGNVNIQFREGDAGLRVLEINPRMSGGIGMASLAGPNLPYLALAVFDSGRDAVRIPPVKAGIRVGEVTSAVILS
jgi:carbamoylphosphate synthase large subunit